MSPSSMHIAAQRSERAGQPMLVMALAAACIAIMASFAWLPNEQTPMLLLVLLLSLAFVGVLALVGFAAGFLRTNAARAGDDIARLIADTSPDGLLVTEGESAILYANDAYMALAGGTGGRNGGPRTVDRLFSGAPEVAEPLYRLATAAREGKRCAEELRVTPALIGDAEVAWYRIRVRPLERPDAGRLLGKAGRNGRKLALWTIADVTRERERHENVFQELQHAIDFLDHAPAGFFSTDARGNISYMNATLADWLDFDLSQVGAGGLALRDIVADDSASLLVFGSGTPNTVRTEQIDLDLRRRDGLRLPSRLLHRVAFGVDGAPGASRTLALNRSPGGEPAEEARAAEVRFARFFNSTPMAIATVDRAGKIQRSNAAFAKLLPGAASVGTVLAGVAEAHRGGLLRAVQDASSGSEDNAPIDAALTETGKSARLFVTPNEENGERGASVFVLDTTEERNREEQLHQSQKMQAVGQLAGGVAHDFNNVLTAILGYSELLLANHRPTDPSFQDIMQIKQNANRAAGLVRQLLAFSRRQTLRPQVLQLGDVLSDLQMLTRRLVGEKIEVSSKQARDLWLVKADLNQFEQVIMNLIVNARDAMPDGGKIFLRVKNVAASECAAYACKQLPEADYVVVEVEDTGTGIPVEIRDKIFDPFFTTKEVGKGTGLGLSMVYGIVKQTGGFIYCDSTIGRGTTFRIFLTRHIPGVETVVEEEKPAVPEKKPAADHTGAGVVLLVEDEEAVRSFGARALSSRGYTVLEAESGVDALRVVDENPGRIDLVVSDVVMPEMDGPTMFGELRKRGIKARVIFVSGYAEDAFSKNLPEGEDFGFMPKPFTLKQLIETVKANMK
ncbi:two-component system cell cycle sensor histidine kinase/response regulator CckA [Rhodoblastus acidophilus]|uniref:cell cycle histidine kinase CckA n=1 Tax=Rhodoblastus acidophilus TaxID=1074 RepID=UPI00222525BD|nr:ATP-binding protein [Rhodoblastus acidophilus]MCW2285448.1 two-component system cell cycle sensor histidine kinase/response regulator CckA [Rhodoblastus acidophilus]MCW2334468.1 two-component system cell cycle sensor histidine kinase/response regulator CckA [Rhodoblastus acidophilus]